MIININELKGLSHHEFEEDVVFDADDLSKIDLLKELKNAHVKVKVELVSPYLIVKLHLDSEMVLYSSRSLKEVPFKISEDDELTFLLEKQELDDNDDEIPVIEGKELDLYPYIYILFNGSIPMKIIAADDEETLSGDSWELISEDEYYKRKNSNNNAFEKIKGLFDEEE